MLKTTVSGSFHRHMPAIVEAVNAFRDAGVVVLSPADPRIVDFQGEFLFVASDRLRSIRLVEDRHLECIRASDFIWLVAPDGYVGPSAALEIGFAVSAGTPIYCSGNISDISLKEYVSPAESPIDAVRKVRALDYGTHHDHPHVLIAPEKTLNDVHQSMDILQPYLLGASRDSSVVERAFNNAQATLSKAFGLRSGK